MALVAGGADGPMPRSGDTPRPVIDWAGLESQFKGNQNFLTRLAATAREVYAGVPARLRGAARRNDAHDIAEIAHGVKGSSGNLLAYRTTAIAERTEQAALRRQADTPALAEQLAVSVEELMAALHSPYGDAVIQAPTPIVDWAQLDERFRGRTALIDQLVGAARRDYGGVPAQLRDAAHRGDRETLADLAHGLKGASDVLGAKRVFDAATRAESAARDACVDAPARACDLADALEEMLGALNRQPQPSP